VVGLGAGRPARPPAPPPRPAETISEALRGQLTVWGTPGLLPVLSMHVFGYAAMATVLAVWAGPYLAEVHGLAPGPRGAVLLAMGLVLPLGLLGVGPLERRLNTRKWLVVGLAAGVVAVLAALALRPGMPLGAAVALLLLLCLLSCYPVVVVAHGRSLFPDHLVGRGATTVNLAQTLGSAALPALTGWAVALASSGGGTRGEVWSIAFGLLAVALALGVAGYLAGRDAPPRPG
jgi:predicted MFS family arabinose efflux permease